MSERSPRTRPPFHGWGPRVDLPKTSTPTHFMSGHSPPASASGIFEPSATGLVEQHPPDLIPTAPIEAYSVYPPLPETQTTRRGLPLFLSLVPALLVAIAFMVVLWQVTSSTASKSVGSLSDRVFDVVKLQLAAQVRVLTRDMAATAQMGAAAVLVDSSVTSLQRFFYHTLNSIAGASVFSYITVTGRVASVRRMPTSGELQVGQYDPDSTGNDTGNSSSSSTVPLLEYWKVNAQLEKTALVSATPFNLSSQSFYNIMYSNNLSATFSPVYRQVAQGAMGLSLGVPVRFADGSIPGVVTVNYDLSTLQEALHDAHHALATSGMLVLLAEDGSLITSSVDHATADVME
eukprot:RCo024631